MIIKQLSLISRILIMSFSFLSLFGCGDKSQRELERFYSQKGQVKVEKFFGGDLNTLFYDFDEDMKQATPIEKLIEIKKQLSNYFGPVKKIKTINVVKTKDKSNNDIYVTKYIIYCKNGNLHMTITFNSTNQIVGMWINPE